MADEARLKRYTTLAAAMDMLVESRLALLPPSSWKDVNDTRFLEKFRSHLNLKSVCAACFTQRPETYHHWQVFAGTNEGVCVELDKDALLSSLTDLAYMWDDVRYLKLPEIKAMKEVDVYRLPFMKRQGFGDEKEFRLLWRSADESIDVHHVPIQRSWIKRIVLNPWLKDALFPSIKRTLNSIPDCELLPVTKTTLIDHAAWKEAAERVDEFAILMGPPPRLLA